MSATILRALGKKVTMDFMKKMLGIDTRNGLPALRPNFLSDWKDHRIPIKTVNLIGEPYEEEGSISVQLGPDGDQYPSFSLSPGQSGQLRFRMPFIGGSNSEFTFYGLKILSSALLMIEDERLLPRLRQETALAKKKREKDTGLPELYRALLFDIDEVVEQTLVAASTESMSGKTEINRLHDDTDGSSYGRIRLRFTESQIFASTDWLPMFHGTSGEDVKELIRDFGVKQGWCVIPRPRDEEYNARIIWNAMHFLAVAMQADNIRRPDTRPE